VWQRLYSLLDRAIKLFNYDFLEFAATVAEHENLKRRPKIAHGVFVSENSRIPLDPAQGTCRH
jgi:hypothetical protein